MITTFVIWEIRLIPEIGISDVLLKGMWKPVNLKIDLGNKWLREKELYKKIASEDFKKLNLWRGIMNFMLMNSRGQNYRRIRIPSTISWTEWENYTVRLMNCMIQRISRTPDPCTVDNSHTFLVNRRYFLSKMSEETCLAAPKLCRPIFGIRSFRRRFYKSTCTCTCRWWWRKRRDTKFEVSEKFVDRKFIRPCKGEKFYESWGWPTTTSNPGTSISQVPYSTNAYVLENKVQNGSVLLLNFFLRKPCYGSFAIQSGSYSFPDFALLDASIASSLDKIIQNSNFKKKSVWRNRRLRKQTDSFAGDRPLTWSSTTSGSLASTILCSIVPTYSLLFFGMTIFWNSIQDGTTFYYLWNNSHLMIFSNVCTTWEYESLINWRLY